MNIIIDTSATKSSGKNILTAVEDIRSQIRTMESLADKLNSVWQSDDGKKCSETLKTQYIAQLKKLADSLEAYGTFLQKVEQVYTALDNSFSNKNIGV